MRLIRIQNILSVLVASALQVMPLLRVTPSVFAPVTGPLAIILRWATCSAAVLGGFHAVSGASTTITSAKTVTGKVGVAFSYRITTGPDSANVFAATPLPPGLAVNPPGKNGFIMGTPTTAGVTTVKLTASDSGRPDRTVSTNLVITITASVTAPTITVAPKSVSVPVGSSPILTVTAAGSAPLAYQWRLNSANVMAATNATLTLTNLSVAQGGGYDVVVTNSAGKATSAVAVVTVLRPPSFLSLPADQTVNAGGQAVFSASADGTAPITYQWLLGTAVIPDATNSSLTLSNVQSTAQGDYSLVLSNSVGTTSSPPARLTVIVPVPLALLNPRLEGSVFKFHVQGTPNASFVLWKSADLLHWTPVLTNQVSTTLFEYSDPDITLDRTDFYHATQLP